MPKKEGDTLTIATTTGEEGFVRMAAPERVTSGVYRVDAVGFSNAVSVLLLEDADGWTLVDTGAGSNVRRIREALAALGEGPEDLRRIYLTHHSDHVGGLPGVHR